MTASVLKITVIWARKIIIYNLKTRINTRDPFQMLQKGKETKSEFETYNVHFRFKEAKFNHRNHSTSIDHVFHLSTVDFFNNIGRCQFNNLQLD